MSVGRRINMENPTGVPPDSGCTPRLVVGGGGLGRGVPQHDARLTAIDLIVDDSDLCQHFDWVGVIGPSMWGRVGGICRITAGH